MELVKKYVKERGKYNKNKIKIDKEHDKIFKKVFSNKKEASKLISKVIGKEIKEEEIEVSQNSFVTTELKYREADIVYKEKGRNIIFLIEHQTKEDKKMSYRILNYQIEIMRANEKEKGKESLVIGIVIYTGRRRWKAKRYIKEIQEKIEEEEEVKEERKIEKGRLGYYELIDINTYTKEELMKEESILSKVMLIEKERNTEDLLKIIKEINEKVKEKEGKEVIYDMMYLALRKKIEEKELNKIMEKLIKEGSDYMLAVEERRKHRRTFTSKKGNNKTNDKK